jgi:hypothetical protein
VLPFPLLGIDLCGCSTASGSAVAPHQLLPGSAEADLKTRDGAKVTTAVRRPGHPAAAGRATPHGQRRGKRIMEDVLAELNPAAIQRQIQALTAELLTLTTSTAARRRETRRSGHGSARIRS